MLEMPYQKNVSGFLQVFAFVVQARLLIDFNHAKTKQKCRPSYQNFIQICIICAQCVCQKQTSLARCLSQLRQIVASCRDNVHNFISQTLGGGI